MRQIPGFAQLSNQGRMIDPTFQLFDFTDGKNLPTIDDLPLEMTVAGVTQATPLVCYRGVDASAAGWNAYGGYGPNLSLAGAGTDPSYDQDTPLYGANDRGIQFNTGKYFQNTATNIAFSTHDYVIEMVVKCGPGNINRWLDCRDPTGVVIYGTAGSLYGQLRGAASTQVTLSSSMVANSWNHIIGFVNRDWNNNSSFRGYINGRYSGQGNIKGREGDDLTSTKCYIGTRSLGVGLLASDGSVLYAAIYARAGWLPTNTTDLDSCAAERFALTSGLYPQVAKGSWNPYAINSGARYLDRYVGTDRKMFLVGSDWFRVCHRRDKNNTELYGCLIEDSSQQKFLYSEQFDDANWTKTGCTISANSAVAPDGQTTMDSLIADNAAPNAQSTVHQAPTLAATRYTASIFVKKGDRDHFFIDDTTIANGCAWFNLSTKAVGTKEAGVRVSDIQDWGTWLRLHIVFIGTAAAHTIEFGACDADNSKACTGDGATVSAYIWGANIHGGWFLQSYTLSTSAMVTPSEDDLTFLANDGNVTNNKTGTLAFDFLAENGDTNYISSAEIVTIFDAADADANKIIIDDVSATSGTLGFETTVGGVDTDCNSTVFPDTFIQRSIKAIWKVGEQKFFINGAQEGGTQNPVDIPDDLSRITFGYHNYAYMHGAMFGNFRIYDEYDVEE